MIIIITVWILWIKGLVVDNSKKDERLIGRLPKWHGAKDVEKMCKTLWFSTVENVVGFSTHTVHTVSR